MNCMDNKNYTLLVYNILKWYNINRRDLPWRNINDPYKIWLSEILLQQTRVDQGLPYYVKFIKAFPDIQSLACADEKLVLGLWQGLGYYSRARNMHATAKKIVSEFEGKIPDSYKELLKLKGIGKYTAAAIASFAFEEKVAVVDGNVYRVLSRLFGIETDIASSLGQKEFFNKAQEIMPIKDGHLYNQAIMEFGALHCTPKNPQCDTCPLQTMCHAYKHNLQAILPRKEKKTVKRDRYFNYLLFKKGNTFLLRERKEKDIWQGMYEFYLVEDNKLAPIEDLLANNFKSALIKNFVLTKESTEIRHILSHQNIFSKTWCIEVKDTIAFNMLMKMGLSSVHQKNLKELPKPVLITRFLEESAFI